jgi:hypothetical protein
MACGREGEDVMRPSPAASATPSATRETTPTPTPGVSPTTATGTTPSDAQAAEVGWVFFLRPPEEPWTPETDYWEQLGRGDLWMANADGSGEQQITFGKTNVTFAGFLTTEDGPILYYTSGDETTFDLWRKVLKTGAETKLLSFNVFPYWRGGSYTWPTLAAVCPDGRYAALVEVRDVVLADLATGEGRTLFESNHPECEEINIVSCFSYGWLHWSPDGSLLAVVRSEWESGREFIVDPFAPFAQPVGSGPFDIPNVQGEIDWRTSDEACATAAGLDPSGLYLIQGPNWAFDRDQAEDISGYCPDLGRGCRGWVEECAWLDDTRIAFQVNPFAPSGPIRIEVIDVDTREITTLAEFTDEGSATQIIHMFVLRGEGLIVYNRLHYVSHGDILHREQFTTSALIRVADGSHQPILRERDHVIALVPAARAE